MTAAHSSGHADIPNIVESFDLEIQEVDCWDSAFESTFPSDFAYVVGEDKITTDDFGIVSATPVCTSQYNISFVVKQGGSVINSSPFI